jgi:hypothetical protein
MTPTPLPTSAAERARPHLLAELERVRALLLVHTGEDVNVPERPQGTVMLERIVDRLALSEFERDLLMLSAAVQLDGGLAALTATAQGGTDPRPTFALAMAALPGAHWDAVAPHRPLRRWRLLDPEPGPVLATRPLTIDEAVLHAITGLDDPAAPGGLPVLPRTAEVLTASQRAVADELAATIGSLSDRVLVRLDGDDPEARVEVARRCAEHLGQGALVLDPARLPAAADPTTIACTVDREAQVRDLVPVVADAALAEALTAPAVVLVEAAPAASTAAGSSTRTALARTVSLPVPAEQSALWQETMPAAVDADAARATAEIAQHYRLSARSVRTIAAEWAQAHGDGADLRRLTRNRARSNLGILAERIEPRSTWDDLVLPDGPRQLLSDLAQQVRHRSTVYDDWGFAQTSARGLGITGLFAGESGTGKTMAAEVLAADLELDLYRIDLSSVVSKYIGETEKNLKAVFDGAEASGAILLFDEADALFGKRSDVKDSHDRYANVETAYLLQRMEAYRGLAILTTNLRANLDQAFLRRLRFVVQFPFPDESLREQIWARAFPRQTPTEGLDPRGLARMQISGGSIRSIALAAAFAAAEAGTPVRPEHVLHAARVDYAKAERSLTDAEARGIGGAR